LWIFDHDAFFAEKISDYPSLGNKNFDNHLQFLFIIKFPDDKKQISMKINKRSADFMNNSG